MSQSHYEKDPRGVLLKLSLFSILLDNFQIDQYQQSVIYEDHLECYYPIMFQMQKSDFNITREELEHKLN